MNTDEFTEDFQVSIEKQLVAAIVTKDRVEIERLVKEEGVSPNIEGMYDYTPIRIAIEISSPEILSLLLDLGADPNYRATEGSVAGDWAALDEDPIYLTLLLEAGMDANIKHGDTPIIFDTIPGSRWEHYDMLVAHGADHLHTKTGANKTVALRLATQFEYKRLKALIEMGADVSTPTNTGLTVVENLAKMQQRFSANPQHRAYIARVELLEMLRDRGLEIPDDIPGVHYPDQQQEEH